MISRLLGCALVFLSPVLLEAQDGRQRADEDDPVEVLLEIRRELDLTREQISSMREIQRALEEKNRPLVQQLMAIQRQVRSGLVGLSANGRDGNRPTQAQMDAARAPLQEIQENNIAAMEQVNAVLTAEQKRRATTILQIRERLDRRPGWMRWPSDRSPD